MLRSYLFVASLLAALAPASAQVTLPGIRFPAGVFVTPISGDTVLVTWSQQFSPNTLGQTFDPQIKNWRIEWHLETVAIREPIACGQRLTIGLVQPAPVFWTPTVALPPIWCCGPGIPGWWFGYGPPPALKPHYLYAGVALNLSSTYAKDWLVGYHWQWPTHCTQAPDITWAILRVHVW